MAVKNYGLFILIDQLVENGNASELTDQLNMLINDIERRKHCQKLSPERVEIFQLKNIINKWNEIPLKVQH